MPIQLALASDAVRHRSTTRSQRGRDGGAGEHPPFQSPWAPLPSLASLAPTSMALPSSSVGHGLAPTKPRASSVTGPTSSAQLQHQQQRQQQQDYDAMMQQTMQQHVLQQAMQYIQQATQQQQQQLFQQHMMQYLQHSATLTSGGMLASSSTSSSPAMVYGQAYGLGASATGPMHTPAGLAALSYGGLAAPMPGHLGLDPLLYGAGVRRSSDLLRQRRRPRNPGTWPARRLAWASTLPRRSRPLERAPEPAPPSGRDL